MTDRLSRFKASTLNWRSLRHLREAVIIAGSYFVYMFVRKYIIPDIETVSFVNSFKIVSFELATGLFWEARWQAWIIENSKALVMFLNWAYIVTFIPLLLITTVLVYFKDQRRYFYYRNVWLLSFIFALIVFAVFPLAPPRFLPEHGFVDSIQRFGPSWYGGREMVGAFYYNIYAAMPSLHFGWTVLFGVLFFRMGGKWLKVCGVLYPTMTFFAITLTGNHFVLDALGGAAVILAAFLLYEGSLFVRLRTPIVYGFVKVRTTMIYGFAKMQVRRAGTYLYGALLPRKLQIVLAYAGARTSSRSDRLPIRKWMAGSHYS